MFRRQCLCLALCVTALGCTQAGEEVFTAKQLSCSSKDVKLTEDEGDDLELADQVVSWREDILPMLSAADEVRRYKCVNCHPLYADIEQLNSPEKLGRVINAVDRATNPNASMPVGGSFLASDVALLRAWQQGGFLEKAPEKAKKDPKVATSTATTGTATAKDKCQ